MNFQFVNPTKNLENVMRKTKFLQNVILAYYKPIVEKEVCLSDARYSDKILCVGGGYFPCTAILFHKLTGATVTVIDNDKGAIEKSTELIESLGLKNKVIVKYTDGVDVSGEAFDVIHIAMQISPKETVFKRIHSTMRKESKILVRTPKEHLERGYQPFKEICAQMKSVKQPFFSNIDKTMLYVR